MDRGAWQATVHGITESWTQLRNQEQHSIASLKEGGIWTGRDTDIQRRRSCDE